MLTVVHGGPFPKHPFPSFYSIDISSLHVHPLKENPTASLARLHAIPQNVQPTSLGRIISNIIYSSPPLDDLFFTGNPWLLILDSPLSHITTHVHQELNLPGSLTCPK
jgi:hypothetical protein